MNGLHSNLGMGSPSWLHAMGPILLVILLWSLFWKGLALWHAARRGSRWWFVILLILNTVGILEIIYLFVVLRLTPSRLFKK